MGIHVGTQVRVADAAALAEALRVSEAERRPAPGQMLWAGRTASVVGFRHGPGDRSLYVLKGAPGLWPEEWIAAA